MNGSSRKAMAVSTAILYLDINAGLHTTRYVVFITEESSKILEKSFGLYARLRRKTISSQLKEFGGKKKSFTRFSSNPKYVYNVKHKATVLAHVANK